MNEVKRQDARTGTPEAMPPPSYKALSVEYTPWTHTPGIRVLPPRRAPPRASQQNPCPPSGANRQRDCTACTLVPCPRDRHLKTVTRAHCFTTHSPVRPRDLTRYMPPRYPALGRSALDGRPPPRHLTAPTHRRPKASPRHESHAAQRHPRDRARDDTKTWTRTWVCSM